MWLCLFYILARTLIISTEVITLINKHDITCVLTGDSVYSALYMTPSIDRNEKFVTWFRVNIEIKNWKNDDWKVINSFASHHGPVTDIRWESFESKQDRVLNLRNNTWFSVCSSPDLTPKFKKEKKTTFSVSFHPQNNSNFKNSQFFCEWTHHFSTMQDKFWIIEQLNGKPLKHPIKYYNRREFKINNYNSAPIKLHNYDFKYADFITNTSVSYINISNLSNSKNICLSMFVSIDENCYLKLILDSDNQTNTTKLVPGFNKKNDLKGWKRIEIESGYNGTGKLFLLRRRYDDNQNGYWAIHNIHLCKTNLDFYRTTLPPKNAPKDVFCKTLEKSSNHTFCNKTGYLGSNCNITCKESLNSSFPFCENHKICLEDNTCQCAWGFEKPDCIKRCKDNHWGLDCKCNYRCATCHHIKGCTKCKAQFFGNDCQSRAKGGAKGAPAPGANILGRQIPTKLKWHTYKQPKAYRDFVCIFDYSVVSMGLSRAPILSLAPGAEFPSHGSDDCSDTFPVLLNPPRLVSITDDTLIISSDMQHGRNESDPDFYQIQYKEISEKTYRNYSTQKPYFNNSENITIATTIMNTINASYNVRIMLLVKNQAFVGNAPVLNICKRSLITVNKSDEDIKLQWSHPDNSNGGNYLIEYECRNEFCHTSHKNHTKITNMTTTRIGELEKFKICTVKLFAYMENENQLIDEIVVKLQNSSNKIERSELPKNVSFKENKIVVELGNCDKFSGPLSYQIMYKCNSTWCNQNKNASVTIPLDKYNQTLEKDLKELKPFSDYNIEVTAKRSDQNFTVSEPYFRKTPPSKPLTVENLTIYCSSESVLWIRWQEPYPPTGTVEAYNFTYQKVGNITVSSLNFTSDCELWDNFLCVNITGLENQTDYNISVRVKNFGKIQWSDQINVIGSTIQKAPQPPEVIKIHLTSKTNLLNLTWNHPFNMNGPIEKFRIKINNKTSNLTIKKYQRSYNFTFSVEERKQYNISVSGTNTMDGDKTILNATIFPPISEFSPGNFVKWCSEHCYLLVPKPIQHNVSFEITIVLKNKGTNKEMIFIKYKPLKNRSYTDMDQSIVNFSYNGENEVQLEIGKTAGKAISIENSTYLMYLVLNETENSIYPVKDDEPANPASDVMLGNVYVILVIVLIVIATIVIILLLSFLLV